MKVWQRAKHKIINYYGNLKEIWNNAAVLCKKNVFGYFFMQKSSRIVWRSMLFKHMMYITKLIYTASWFILRSVHSVYRWISHPPILGSSRATYRRAASRRCWTRGILLCRVRNEEYIGSGARLGDDPHPAGEDRMGVYCFVEYMCL